MIIGTAKKKKMVLFSVLWALKRPMAIRVNLLEFFFMICAFVFCICCVFLETFFQCFKSFLFYFAQLSG